MINTLKVNPLSTSLSQPPNIASSVHFQGPVPQKKWNRCRITFLSVLSRLFFSGTHGDTKLELISNSQVFNTLKQRYKTSKENKTFKIQNTIKRYGRLCRIFDALNVIKTSCCPRIMKFGKKITYNVKKNVRKVVIFIVLSQKFIQIEYIRPQF